MRILVLASFLTVLMATPVLAQGNSGGNGNGSENSQGQGNSGDNGNNGNGNNGQGSSQNNGSAGGDNSGQGNSNGQGNSGNQGNGQGSGNDNGNGGSNGSGTSGNNGIGSSGSNANNANNGNTPASGNGGQNTGGGNTSTENTVHHSPDFARDTVNSGRAVSLGSLVPDLTQRTGGRVIDAEMLSIRGILVYAVRVLRANGSVTTEYYYAQSGRFIGSEP